MRYFLDVAYRGTQYHGWQVQANAHTVQQELNTALALVFSTNISTIGSGRTDTGVHARQQPVHLDFPTAVDIESVVYKLNKLLPKDISVSNMRLVRDTAHARFDAVSRSYRYQLIKRKSPFQTDLAYYWPYPLDVTTMNQASELLLGVRDFQAFSKVKTQVDNFICVINKAEWSEDNEFYFFDVSANRFLRGMVRAIVGTMLDIGQNRKSLENYKEIINSKDRRKAGRAAPPHGLYLTEVTYPDDIYIN